MDKRKKFKNIHKGKDKHKKSIFIRIVRNLLLFCILTGFIAGIWAFNNPRFFPIHKVRIEASFEHIDQQIVRNIVEPYTKKSFFMLPIGKLRASLLKLPWVFEVTVRRTWPDKVLIKISEQEVVACWNGNALFNINGELFIPSQMPFIANLPLLVGSKDQAEVVWRRYLEVNKFLNQAELYVTKMELLSTLDLKIVLNNGMAMTLANDDFINSINTFIKIHPKLIKENPEKIESIDFRYNNGFAVKWKGAFSEGN